MALFLADATSAVDPTAARTSREPASRAAWRGSAHVAPARLEPGLADAPCTAVSTFVHDAIAAVARIQQVSSALIPWRAPLTADPAANRFGLGLAYKYGHFVSPVNGSPTGR